MNDKFDSYHAHLPTHLLHVINEAVDSFWIFANGDSFEQGSMQSEEEEEGEEEEWSNSKNDAKTSGKYFTNVTILNVFRK